MDKDQEKKDLIRRVEKADKIGDTQSFISSITSIAGFAADTVIPGSSVLFGVTGNIVSQAIGGYVGKTQAQILIQIIEDLDKLKSQVKDFDLSSLQENKAFVTTILRILPLALRNTEKEKMDALRSIVLNTALGNTLDEDLRLMFLNNVDSLTSSHLKILIYFRDPQGWFQLRKKDIPDMSGGAGAGLELAYPEFVGKKTLYTMIVEELITKGLMQKGVYMSASMSSSGVYSKRTTDFGDDFISFITSPIQL